MQVLMISAFNPSVLTISAQTPEADAARLMREKGHKWDGDGG